MFDTLELFHHISWVSMSDTIDCGDRIEQDQSNLTASTTGWLLFAVATVIGSTFLTLCNKKNLFIKCLDAPESSIQLFGFEYSVLS